MPRRLTSETAGGDAPRLGHNLPDDEIQKWFRSIKKLDSDYIKTKNDNDEKIRDIRSDTKSASEAVKEKYRLLKETAGPVAVKVVKTLVEESKRDKEEVAMEKATEDRFREALNMKIQISMDFDAPAAAMTNDSGDAEHARLESIKEKGYSAARAGKVRGDHSYPADSDEEYAYLKGWDEGIKDGVKAMAGKKSGTKPAAKAKKANGSAAKAGKGSAEARAH